MPDVFFNSFHPFPAEDPPWCQRKELDLPIQTKLEPSTLCNCSMAMIKMYPKLGQQISNFTTNSNIVFHSIFTPHQITLCYSSNSTACASIICQQCSSTLVRWKYVASLFQLEPLRPPYQSAPSRQTKKKGKQTGKLSPQSFRVNNGNNTDADS